jgi:hypothetical protein
MVLEVTLTPLYSRFLIVIDTNMAAVRTHDVGVTTGHPM